MSANGVNFQPETEINIGKRKKNIAHKHLCRHKKLQSIRQVFNDFKFKVKKGHDDCVNKVRQESTNTEGQKMIRTSIYGKVKILLPGDADPQAERKDDQVSHGN